MMREVPFGSDGNFAKESIVTTINADLSNEIGNLSQRTLSMIAKNCDGKVPQVKQPHLNEKLEESKNNLLIKVRNHFDNFAFNKAIEEIISHSALANAYISESEPWKLKKEEKLDEMNNVLYNLAENIRYIAILLQPFVPQSASKMLDQLAIDESQRSFAYLKPEYSLKPGQDLSLIHI